MLFCFTGLQVVDLGEEWEDLEGEQVGVLKAST